MVAAIATVTSTQLLSAAKFEYFKFKFTRLRDNLKLVLEFFNSMEVRNEQAIHDYQVMRIKTNFFIDEIDFHLRDANLENDNFTSMEYFIAYEIFYKRSCAELQCVIHEMCKLHYNLVW